MCIAYPDLNPVLVSLGAIKIRWYGIMYLISYFIARFIATRRVKAEGSGWTLKQLDQFFFYGFLGVFFGGRIGYCLFYQFPIFINDPAYVFRVWNGGMSFHGGLIGVCIAMFFLARKQKRSIWVLTDFAAPIVPIGLFFGRIGNFINDNLFGRVTNVPWAICYPNGGYLPRQPSQLYEMFFEGFILFIILNIYIRKNRILGSTSALFLLFYGVFRFILEYFRQPDPQLGFLFGIDLTMGQLLSAPMIVFGIYFLIKSYKKGEIIKIPHNFY
ncbi:MAG: prolipoprotein diacylglyceryl transferase [Psittacicella sp.]